ncbi:hypothetical protein COLO4_06455 [Corchorus olitorius]|uniref:Uncharacterized protein n=1 Tax=Corchorus olitorius TaxID=93759 RepID=A0A1R3KMX8_9ROSI|nr:hypothetical protein COLO4_06455 [Corchorus olitorius]
MSLGSPLSSPLTSYHCLVCDFITDLMWFARICTMAFCYPFIAYVACFIVFSQPLRIASFAYCPVILAALWTSF